MSDIVISGYYGFRNNGDDALLMSIIKDLRAKDNNIDITVLSKEPDETSKIYKTKAVNSRNVFSVISNIAKSKMLISGGGTLIQDRTSTKSLIYYLCVILTALIFRKKVMLYANGIGPVNKSFNQKLAKWILNKVDVITLRDDESEKELTSLGVTKPKIQVTADPAFSIETDGDIDFSANLNDKKLLCVAVRDWDSLPSDFCQTIADVCDYASGKYGLFTVFLPMQKRYDVKICQKIQYMMKSESSFVFADYDIEKTIKMFKRMTVSIGMRLHSLIYSSIACVPFVGLVYDPKVSGFLDYIGVDNYLDVEKITFQNLKNAIEECMENYDDNASKLTNKSLELAEKARKNSEIAIELLTRGAV